MNESAGKETVLVTGAAGTVGAYVVEELLRRGCRVIATDRPGSQWRLPKDGAVEVREGDLTDLSFAVDAIAGATSVIHTAATLDLSLPYEIQARINVDAVRYLYEAGRVQGIHRFVHISSGSIYQKTSPMDETTPFDPMSAYEQTKVEAERYLWSRPRSGPAVTVLRPTMIYGPRARFLAARLTVVPPMLALLHSRLPTVRGMPRCNWVHAEDVARAAVFLAFESRAAWEAYNVADDTPTEFGGVIELIARSYGFEIGRAVRYPRRLMTYIGPVLAERDLILGAANLAAARIWKLISERHDLVPEIVPHIDRELFLYASRDAIFDNTKLRRLGFEFKYKSIEEGYPPVLKWFQEQRWVPTYDRKALNGGGGGGFKFDETLAGTWRTPEGEPKPFEFTFTARAPSARQFASDGLLAIEGTVTAEGLARSRPFAGTLDISWRKKRELAYDFRFADDDGRAIRFSGKQDVRLLNLIETMTTLPGRMTDEAGGEVGTVIAYFDLRRDLLGMVGSFRLAGPAQSAPAPAKAAAGAGAGAGG